MPPLRSLSYQAAEHDFKTRQFCWKTHALKLSYFDFIHIRSGIANLSGVSAILTET